MVKNMADTSNKYKLSFAAIDQYLEDHIVKPTEIETAKNFITWGKNNDYPCYINGLYNNVATLKSIIDGLSDYVVGDDVKISTPQFSDTVNSKGDTFKDVFEKCVKDYCVFGGFAINIIKNKVGGIAEIYYLDFKNIRSNKDRTSFYYTTDWSKSYGRVKFLEYPAYSEDKNVVNSILYYSNEYNKVYPTPIYGASLQACEIEKAINEYHLNSINNGFTGSYIVNFNGGKPTDEQKMEIEENFYEKYTGYQNGSRPVLVFNDSKDSEVTIAKVNGDDFADRYTQLSKRSKQELFTAFRATPNLFGIMTETTGFSQQEFREAYTLFNRTMVKPIQNRIVSVFEKVFGKDTIEITPFQIEWEN